MTCPSCGAPMHVQGGSLVCDYCKTVVVPERDSSGVVVLEASPNNEACPICNVLLMQATLGRRPLLYCTKCHGMLVAMMDFQSLIDAARTASAPIPELPADPNELDRRIACPHCHKTMDAHFYMGAGNVVMDTCETCCLHWLDHDELARIAQANATQPNPIDRDDSDAFYSADADRDSNDSTSQSDFDVQPPDTTTEVVDLLSRVLKPRI
jgi:Zn-finger nucleic acid-binding protein